MELSSMSNSDMNEKYCLDESFENLKVIWKHKDIIHCFRQNKTNKQTEENILILTHTIYFIK